MTLHFPDVSSYQAGITLPEEPLIIAKATEGVTYFDKEFENWRKQAKHLFSGYHFLRSDSSPVDQADWYFAHAGLTPCMLDVESSGSSAPHVEHALNFMARLREHGGRVWGVYYPRWWWNTTGGDLGRLEAAGAVLVSSAYTNYSDDGFGWNSYGGATPKVWQYTNYPMDMNAFKGTQEELASIINGVEVTPQDIKDIAFAVWDYKGEDGNPPYAYDNPDVHQTLEDIKDLLTKIEAKLGA